MVNICSLSLLLFEDFRFIGDRVLMAGAGSRITTKEVFSNEDSGEGG